MTLPLILAACTGDDTTPTGEVSWSEAFDTSEAGSLSGVWGSGPDDLWVVGGDEVRGEVWHGDGDGFTRTELPEVGLLVWVFGFGPDDALAVGIGGGVVHWDGAAWTPRDSGTDVDLWGVWGTSPTDLWLVGGDPDAGTPVLLHHDGVGFTPYALDPAENDRGAHALFKVFGVDGRVFAVGQYGLIVELVDDVWRQLPTGAGATDDFVSLWGPSADRLVAVGGRSNGQVATFDGAAWTTTAPDTVPGLNAVTVLDQGTFVVGGIGGWVGTFDPDSGAAVREVPAATRDVHALWAVGDGSVLGVGGTFYPPHEGIAVIREEVP